MTQIVAALIILRGVLSWAVEVKPLMRSNSMQASSAMTEGHLQSMSIDSNAEVTLAQKMQAPVPTVTCKLTTDFVLVAVSYNGTDITPSVSPNDSGNTASRGTVKSVTFTASPNAYLVITGYDVEHGTCQSAGLAVACNSSIGGSADMAQFNWTSYSAGGNPNVLLQEIAAGADVALGHGSGWQTPCISSSGFSLSEENDRSHHIWAPAVDGASGSVNAAFMALLPASLVPEGISCFWFRAPQLTCLGGWTQVVNTRGTCAGTVCVQSDAQRCCVTQVNLGHAGGQQNCDAVPANGYVCPSMASPQNFPSCLCCGTDANCPSNYPGCMHDPNDARQSFKYCQTGATSGDCLSDATCQSGNCGPSQTCIPKYANGGICYSGRGSQCTSDFCVQGLCCNSGQFNCQDNCCNNGQFCCSGTCHSSDVPCTLSDTLRSRQLWQQSQELFRNISTVRVQVRQP